MADLILGQQYESDPIRPFAEEFNQVVNNIVSESTVDYYRNFDKVLTDPSSKTALREFFTANTIDMMDPEYKGKPAVIDRHNRNMDMLFENDCKALLEAGNLNDITPLMGMALPMHKNIMMNMVFDKGGIPKLTAPGPRFNRTMENRYLVDTEGKKIDMWLEQNKMTAAMQKVNPIKTKRFTLASTATDIKAADYPLGKSEDFDWIGFLGGVKGIDNIDPTTYVSAVLFKDIYFGPGDIAPDENGNITDKCTKISDDGEGKTCDVWLKVRGKFTPGYGDIKLQIMKRVAYQCKQSASGDVVVLEDTIVGKIKDNKIGLSTMKGIIKGIEISTKIDASQRTIKNCSVAWDETTDTVIIGTDDGVSAQVSPEEIKDYSLMYNINQVSKLMSLMKTAIVNRKDDKIKDGLDESYGELPESQKFQGVFDYSPREGYYGDHIEWRVKTFWDYFDTQITQMLRVLNDPNVTVSVFGEPDIVRKITPANVTYSAPTNIGPVELDFSKTVVTSNNRVYSFVGSDKLRTNDRPEFIITLCPRNSNRIIYVIYDYQFYISNEIRRHDAPALPNILVFERWLFDWYQPVQGRIFIANPSGLRSGQTETLGFAPFLGWDSKI